MNQKKILFTALSFSLFLGAIFWYSLQLEERTRVAELGRAHRSQQALQEQLHKDSASQIEQTKPAETFSISMDWLEITKSNFWGRDKLFAQNELRSFPSIKFSYPSNWRFNCCSDMDHATANFFTPLDLDGHQVQGSPYVNVLNHGLRGCPEVTESCSLDKQIILSTEEKMNNLINTLPSNVTVLPEKLLSGINKKAFAYTYSKSRESNVTLYESYLVNIGEDIIEIQFKDPEKLGMKFVETFLQEIHFDTNSTTLPSLDNSSFRKLLFCNAEYETNTSYSGSIDIVRRIAELSTQQNNKDFCDNFIRNKPENPLSFQIYRRPMDVDYSPDEYYVRGNGIWKVKGNNIYILGGFDGSLEFYGAVK